MKMKKMMFLMLTLLVWGAVSMNAQVRIGGSTDPNPSAALDLNADNTATPATVTGGLSLPRVSLDTTNVKLKGATPTNGTIVYNTNVSMKGGQGAGIYVWNGSKWNFLTATVPVTSLTLSPSGTVNLPVGATLQLTATTAPINATNPVVSWTSSNTIAATISATGLVTAKAVGTSNITVATNDGSGKSSTATVNVFAKGEGTATNGTRTYRTYTFPGDLGTWTMTDSKEGIRDTIVNGTYYYSFAHAPSACVSPWRLPDSIAVAKFAAFLDYSTPMVDLWLGTGNNEGPQGAFYLSSYSLGAAQNRQWWWSASARPDGSKQLALSAFKPNRFQTVAENTNHYYFTVRCRRD